MTLFSGSWSHLPTTGLVWPRLLELDVALAESCIRHGGGLRWLVKKFLVKDRTQCHLTNVGRDNICKINPRDSYCFVGEESRTRRTTQPSPGVLKLER